MLAPEANAAVVRREDRLNAIHKFRRRHSVKLKSDASVQRTDYYDHGEECKLQVFFSERGCRGGVVRVYGMKSTGKLTLLRKKGLSSRAPCQAKTPSLNHPQRTGTGL